MIHAECAMICLQDLRLQFAGAIPLSKQEKFSKSLLQLQTDKTALQEELRNVRSLPITITERLMISCSMPLCHNHLKMSILA